MSERNPFEGQQGPALRTIAMPADTNPSGDIFGGWLLAQMDLAGSMIAVRRAGGRVVTVGVEAMTFHKPVFVGDEVSFFSTIERIGRSSISVLVESWVRRPLVDDTPIKVTQGVFTYVAMGADRKPRVIDPQTTIQV